MDLLMADNSPIWRYVPPTSSLAWPVLALLCVTVATRLWLDDRRTLPYFPIEISRMLATGPWAKRVFILGLGLLMVFYAHDKPVYLIVCGEVLGLALVDDSVSWLGHMIFVWAMLGTIAIRAWTNGRTAAFLAAMALYGMRVLFKAVALWQAGHGFFAFNKTLELMFTGKFPNDTVELAFQVSGVVQWTVFGLLATLV
jgi:hypothetical protein